MNCRAKLNAYGVQALSNVELMSIVANTSVSVAEKVLEYGEGLSQDYGQMSVKELAQIYGIGEVKSAQIIASMALAKRIESDNAFNSLERFGDSSKVVSYFNAHYGQDKRERFVCFRLNSKLRLEGVDLISIGNLDSAPVHPRDVFNNAVRTRAAAIIVAHNHPSGDVTPSNPDIDVTNRLVQAGEVIGIKVLDHIIVGNGKFTSMKFEGYL